MLWMRESQGSPSPFRLKWWLAGDGYLSGALYSHSRFDGIRAMLQALRYT